MIAILSDIHGNFTALQEALKVIKLMGAEKIYCLGDIVGYYTQINECCEMLQQEKVQCIMGNHDWYMISGSLCPRSKSVNECLEYQRKIISPKNLQWLSSLPCFLKWDTISMVHGGWTNPIDEYLEPSAKYFSKIDGMFFFSGHTHVQQLTTYEGKIYCNPGSIGQPRDGDNRAGFAMFDGQNVSLHRVSYDINNVGILMNKAGFTGYYYGCLYTGAKKLCWRGNSNV